VLFLGLQQQGQLLVQQVLGPKGVRQRWCRCWSLRAGRQSTLRCPLLRGALAKLQYEPAGNGREPQE